MLFVAASLGGPFSDGVNPTIATKALFSSACRDPELCTGLNASWLHSFSPSFFTMCEEISWQILRSSQVLPQCFENMSESKNTFSAIPSMQDLLLFSTDSEIGAYVSRQFKYPTAQPPWLPLGQPQTSATSRKQPDSMLPSNTLLCD
jgi:hypothetical protein